METNRTPHSLDHLGPARRFWWNADFLDLMARRLRLSAVRSALDVGCGVGHWTATIASLLPPEARIVGVDPEPEWIRIASEIAERVGEGQRRFFALGSAEALAFPDALFDLVTCQTLLIHLPSPRTALVEMARVLKPGGRLLLVEPDNLVQALCGSSQRADEAVEDTLARVEFHVRCEKGRRLLGEGDYSIGDRLPGLLDELGLHDIQVFQSDRALGMWGAHDAPDQAAFTAPALGAVDLRAAACSPWSPEDARRYFLAAGGTEGAFEEAVRRLEAQEAATRQAIRDRTFDRAGGRLLYLISGRKG